METTSLAEFAQAARTLARAARQRDLQVPTFRCPPSLPVDRSIRRGRSGAVVAVRVKGRPFVAVAADLVEGIIVANRLLGPDALRVRGALWAALGYGDTTVDEAPGTPGTPQRRVA